MRDRPAFARISEPHLAQLRELVGERGLRQDEVSLQQYGRDETETLYFPPDVVVLPGNANEVVAVVTLAQRDNLPVTPRGAGSGLSGGALPVHGGILLSLERLDRIRSIDRRDMVAEVGPTSSPKRFAKRSRPKGSSIRRTRQAKRSVPWVATWPKTPPDPAR